MNFNILSSACKIIDNPSHKESRGHGSFTPWGLDCDERQRASHEQQDHIVSAPCDDDAACQGITEQRHHHHRSHVLLVDKQSYIRSMSDMDLYVMWINK